MSGIIISVMVFGTALPAQQVFASTVTKDSNKASVSTNFQSDKLTYFKPYVSVKDNKYILKIPSNIEKSINKDDLTIAKNRVKDLNNLIVEYNVKDVSMESGFTIIIDESTSANTMMSTASATSPEGVTKIEAHWNYARVWMSKSACRTVGLAVGGGVTGLLGAALDAIPVAGAVAAAAIGAVIMDYFSGKPYSAIWFDYNYVAGHGNVVHLQ
ncbi:hypothetical protein LL037_25520 (plasmid) [Clostridium estertheticum]|uniref:Glycine zipper family protein n=1 Tax=Clostridium estertheticum TaxID=238834 RepID=A0AA47I9L7_9CLOT|nr:hypothetical protein [Clostridium estertheticum]MBU3157706.1 hypothetical protein [Clostridium estertheticum]MBU3201989.1 hypothetical protein [Clostridium estertheticum]WAG63335.1 hypothetical protein LL038_25550 [Clostridium estertheticum]WAG68240.1 hypothetical protein LL037_25520 [Clostridium estertheticum]